jgi:ABC-type Fe2+-enterobactin transport system substrate-binding protein
MSDPNSPSYTNENGKTVSGSAAWLHVISQNGGWTPHHEEYAEDVLKKFARHSAQSSQVLKPEEQRIRRVK